MSEILTKSRARNVFYGGSLFFIAVFVGLTVQSHSYVVSRSTTSMPLTDEVRLGKEVWERNSCINCHTLHGEGAYFAPEVGNVMTRWGVLDDPDAAAEMLGGWIDAQPPGSRAPADAAFRADRRGEARAVGVPALGRQDEHAILAAERRRLRGTAS